MTISTNTVFTIQLLSGKAMHWLLKHLSR